MKRSTKAVVVAVTSRLRRIRLVFALVLFASVSAAVVASVAGAQVRLDDATCGSRANPCPLQKWMQDSLGSKLNDGNLDAVAAGFDKLGAMSPDPTWTDWARISTDGAAAARVGGDVGTRGVKAACKGCHDKFKNDYKAKFRTRPI